MVVAKGRIRGKREQRDTGMIRKDKHENYYLRHLGHLTFDFRVHEKINFI